MAKSANPPLCKCGCGYPTERYLDPSGRFKSYFRYIKGHRPSDVVNGTRTCLRCQERKPISDFGQSKRKNGSLVRSSYCRSCHSTITTENRKKRFGTIRNYWLQRRYGITSQEAELMAAGKDGVCPICRKRRATVVDHCHQTGRVRGLLCDGCNSAIGIIGDTKEALSRAVAYLSDTAE